MPAPAAVHQLIERFRANQQSYTSPSYLEAALRVDFLDPLLRSLGWDVANERGVAEHLREVVVEPRVTIDGAKKAPDYAFRIGGKNKFFVEAKKPSIDIESHPAPARQVRSYGWNGKVTYSLLTDFEGLSVYDTRHEPRVTDDARTARLRHIRFDEFDEHWDWIAERFSREAVASGRLDVIAAAEKGGRRSVPVDDAILIAIRRWRDALAGSIHDSQPAMGAYEISVAVQLLIDRLLFLRIAEDRGLEPENNLLEIARRPDAYEAMVDLFRRSDDRYNSGLFHLQKATKFDVVDELTPSLGIDRTILFDIVESMYWPRSAFNFRVLEAPVLGNVYEQFLGEVLSVDGDGEVRSIEKPEVKKSGGVVYTPEGVVKYMLAQTLDRTLDGMTIEKATGDSRARFSHPLRVLDPACGSGSFLIVAYQRLLDWFLERYSEQPAKWEAGRNPRIYELEAGTYRLTTSERKRILLDHVYGVDIDYQAVEVTKLSLLLKVLENESAESVDQQMVLLHERALPDLGKNIRCGNSIVDKRYYALEPAISADLERARKINPFTWSDEFPEVFGGPRPGFDIVVGNPPYVVLQGENRDDHLTDFLRAEYPAARYKVDLYHIFMEKCSSLVREGGFYSLITPSNWLTNNFMEGLRRHMLQATQIVELNVLDRSVFPKRSVDCAIFIARGASAGSESFAFKRSVPEPIRGGLQPTHSDELVAEEVLDSDYALLTGGGNQAIARILDRMLASGQRLSTHANVNFGKQLRDRKSHPEDVLKNAEIRFGDPDFARRYARCYTGSDVHPWRIAWSGTACLDDDVARKGGTWDPIVQNAAGKVLCRQVGHFPAFALDEHGYQCLNNMFMVTPVDGVSSWYLLGVLNSLPIRAYWLDRFWDRRNTFPKIKGTYLKSLPFPSVVESEEIERLARLIVANRSAGLGASGMHIEQYKRAGDALVEELDRVVAQMFSIDGEDLDLLRAHVDELLRRG
jgi:hypothetical protein